MESAFFLFSGAMDSSEIRASLLGETTLPACECLQLKAATCLHPGGFLSPETHSLVAENATTGHRDTGGQPIPSRLQKCFCSPYPSGGPTKQHWFGSQEGDSEVAKWTEAASLGKDSASRKSLGTERMVCRARVYGADGGAESESHTCQAREFRLHYAQGIKVFQSTQQKSVVKVAPKILWGYELTIFFLKEAKHSLKQYTEVGNWG